MKQVLKLQQYVIELGNWIIKKKQKTKNNDLILINV